MQKQIDDLEEKVETCKTEVGQQIEILHGEIIALKTKLDIVIEIFDALEGVLKFLRWIGIAIVWLAKIGAIIGAGWLALKGHFK
jgi:PII-like signaling protein